jgi:Zn finger protein HypA/HybF involved in hydrogenase expression
MDRCWYNPAARGCKTCEYFMPAERADYVSGYPGADEYCMQGVSLTGRPACATCAGGGSVINGATLGVSECPTCGGDAVEVKPGPIVGCSEWAPSSLPTERS